MNDRVISPSESVNRGSKRGFPVTTKMAKCPLNCFGIISKIKENKGVLGLRRKPPVNPLLVEFHSRPVVINHELTDRHLLLWQFS